MRPSPPPARWLVRLVQLFALVTLLLVGRPVAAAFAPPPITGHVTDTAGKLSRDERLALDKKLEDYRLCSLHEVAVLVTGSLDGETIEDVAFKTFRAWKLGRKEEDDGVLLVVAPKERKLRIETGKGVGGALTDVQSARILADRVKPHLKDDATFAAIDEGTTAIGSALGGCAMRAADAGAIAATRAAPSSGADTPLRHEPSATPSPATPPEPTAPSAPTPDSSRDDGRFVFVFVDVALAALGLVALVVYAAFRDRRLIIPFPFAFVGAGFVTLGVGTATGSVLYGLAASHLTFLGIYLGLWRWVRTVHKAPIRPAASAGGGWGGAVNGGSSSYGGDSGSASSGGGYSGSGGDSGSSGGGGGYSGSGYSGGGGESGGGGASDSY